MKVRFSNLFPRWRGIAPLFAFLAILLSTACYEEDMTLSIGEDLPPNV
jgi:hypothetical protein